MLFSEKNSLKNNQWLLRTQSRYEEIEDYARRYKVSNLMTSLIFARGLESQNHYTLLEPTLRDTMISPFALKDMREACFSIWKAIENKDKIAIFGDYDVDGACSTSLFVKYFQSIGVDIRYKIPSREQGYGPNKEIFDEWVKDGVKLIITVDCGINATEIVAETNKKNCSVIIFDHHKPDCDLPKALAIVNPNRIDDESGLEYLCAAGVVFMALAGLNLVAKENKIKKAEDLPHIIEWLDFVALATICDIVPLIGFNRTLVKQGLKQLRQMKNLGLKKLIDKSKISEEISPYHLAHIIGPRINAGGRIGNSEMGVKLLTLHSHEENLADKIATELDELNKQRQEIEKKIQQEALEDINDNDIIIFKANANWHKGIIGIVASRLKETFNKPAIILSIDQEKQIATASCRSVNGFDIGACILKAKDLLIKGGGHAMAAGFSVHIDNLNKIKEFLTQEMEKLLNTNKINNNITWADLVINPNSIDYNTLQDINKLEPFGTSNPSPKFIISSLKVTFTKVIGKNQDTLLIKATTEENNKAIDIIAFKVKDTPFFSELLNSKGETYHFLISPRANEWGEKVSVQFVFLDAMKA